MLLRASGGNTGDTFDAVAAVRGDAEATGVPHASQLCQLVDAAMSRDAEALVAARDALSAAMSAEAVAETAAVIGTFEMMTRVADATGIALDPQVDSMTAELRSRAGIADFGSARNNPSSPWRRAAGRIAEPLSPVFIKLLGVANRLRGAAAPKA